jgi:exosome complex component MTR3
VAIYICLTAVKALVGKEVWLDPDAVEAQASSGTVILACMPALGTVTNVWQSGRMSPQEAIDVCPHSNLGVALASNGFCQCMVACQERCADTHAIVAQALHAVHGNKSI